MREITLSVNLKGGIGPNMMNKITLTANRGAWFSCKLCTCCVIAVSITGCIRLRAVLAQIEHSLIVWLCVGSQPFHVSRILPVYLHPHIKSIHHFGSSQSMSPVQIRMKLHWEWIPSVCWMGTKCSFDKRTLSHNLSCDGQFCVSKKAHIKIIHMTTSSQFDTARLVCHLRSLVTVGSQFLCHFAKLPTGWQGSFIECWVQHQVLKWSQNPLVVSKEMSDWNHFLPLRFYVAGVSWAFAPETSREEMCTTPADKLVILFQSKTNAQTSNKALYIHTRSKPEHLRNRHIKIYVFSNGAHKENFNQQAEATP